MIIYILSFGFKYGIPHDADIVIDVRFLPNPYFVQRLKILMALMRRFEDILRNGRKQNFYR